MFEERRVVQERQDAVAIGEDRRVLERIMRPDIHLAVWRRPIPVECALDDFDWTMIDDIDEELPVDVLPAAIPHLLTEAGYPDPVALSAIVQPIASHFASFMRWAWVRLRLDVIENDACRKFHADQVTVRLLMPLVGPGTQWMRVGGDPERPDGQLRIGDVGLFKGRVWAEDPVILHRSPPIAGRGITRLLLVVDPLDEVSTRI